MTHHRARRAANAARGIMAATLSLAAILAACAVGPDQGVVDTADTGIAAPGPVAAAPSESAAVTGNGNECAVAASDTLAGTGVGGARIGMGIDDLKRRCRVIADTSVLAAEGMLERQVRMDIGIDTVVAVLANDRIARIHLRTAELRTSDSLGVGTAAKEFGRYANARVNVGEGRMFVTVPRRCGLSFRLTGPVRSGDPALGDLPPGTKVDEVLIVGC